MACEKPDYKRSYVRANELLVSSQEIVSFPFSMKPIIARETDIKCCTFQTAKQFGVDASLFGSGSGIITEYNGMYIIFYDSTEEMYRIRFSLAHEFAHYLLNHDMNVTGEVYDRQEREANHFAAQLLMPEQLIHEAVRRGMPFNANFIQSAFGVSEDAAQNRIKTMRTFKSEWHSREEKMHDSMILSKYQPFLECLCSQTDKGNKSRFNVSHLRKRTSLKGGDAYD